MLKFTGGGRRRTLSRRWGTADPGQERLPAAPGAASRESHADLRAPNLGVDGVLAFALTDASWLRLGTEAPAFPLGGHSRSSETAKKPVFCGQDAVSLCRGSSRHKRPWENRLKGSECLSCKTLKVWGTELLRGARTPVFRHGSQTRGMEGSLAQPLQPLLGAGSGENLQMFRSRNFATFFNCM